QKALTAIAEKDELTEWYDMFLYGTALLMAGQLVDAAEVLDTAISLQGDVSELWTQRAVVEQEQGHPETALRLLKVALELNPRSEIALLNVGYAYESLGRPGDARIAYSEYLRASSGKLAHVKPRRHVIEKLAATP
ncbi:MAG: tetratricopeptide repeat protein, partial [Pseudomonadota bacterium]